MIKMYTFLQLQQQQVENLTLENDKNQYDNKLFLRKKRMEREQKRKDKSYYIFNTKIMKKQKNDK